MNPKNRKVVHLIWTYLNQPLFDRRQPMTLNLRRFMYRHQIQYLERCLTKAYRPEEHFRS